MLSPAKSEDQGHQEEEALRPAEGSGEPAAVTPEQVPTDVDDPLAQQACCHTEYAPRDKPINCSFGHCYILIVFSCQGRLPFYVNCLWLTIGG